MYKPDFNNSITNFSNSILKRFNVDTYHPSIKKIDDLIKNKKKIVVFLFDGIGDNILKLHLNEKSYLRSHVVHTMDATFPPTTVASTNSLLSGKFPIENGWIGWSQYFKDYNRNVAVFWNTDDDTDEYLGKESIIRKYASYERIDSLINKVNKKNIAKAIFGHPIDSRDKRVRFLNKFINRAFASADSKEQSFIYAYWNKPDSILHVKGTKSERVHNNILKIQKLLKYNAKKHPEVAYFVIADHGLIDVDYLSLSSHPDLVETLVRYPSFESRTSNFFVKDGKKEVFSKLFKEYFGKYFELYTKEEVFENHMFGEGTPHKMANEFIGDFIAVAIDKYCLSMNDYPHKLKAHHAGGTKEEFLIDVMYFGD